VAAPRETNSSEPASQPRPAATPVTAQRAATQTPAGEISGRTSRAKTRDAVMRVSSFSEPVNDPFGDSAGKKQEEALKPEASAEPTMPKDEFESEPSPLPAEPRDRSLEPLEKPLDSSLDSPLEQRPLDDASPLPPSSTPDTFSPNEPYTPSEPNDSSMAPSSALSCESNLADCRRGIADLQARGISTIKVGLLIEGVEGEDFPCECKLGREFSPPFEPRNFSQVVFHWKATGVCHKPLYFEDAQLERYGHSWNPILQPVMSGAHFFASVAFLPYNIGLNHPQECIYTLGYYRPGSCAPYMIEAIPFSWRASITEALALTGFGFMLWP
jgi:hypothetical protein